MTKPKRRLAGRLLTGTIRRVLSIVGYGLLGAMLVLITVAVLALNSRPDLEPWHTVHLDEEFEAGAVASFDQYMALEDRLFAELDEEVYAAVPEDERTIINRYHHGSLADPGRWPTNWNRTFLMTAADPRAGVLLLHGMSDSPYSLRSLARTLHARQATVIGLRVPGHGTAPSGLLRVEWEDMAAAVELAMRHLRDVTGDRPLYIVGYSNGGALAVMYVLCSLEDSTLPPADRLVLISAEIGVTKLAALAAWQERLGRLLGMHKLSWNSIKPEYDPFQYKSFALNAGKQAHLVTGEIRRRITRLAASGDLARFPPVLAFQSVVDATVSAPALVQDLFERLPSGGHELVLFDLNRRVAAENLLSRDPRPEVEALLARRDLTFGIDLVTNRDEQALEVVVRRRPEGGAAGTIEQTGLAWPEGVFSLSHIALPFRPDDPLYGGPDAGASPGLQIGNLALRGEHDVLQVSAPDMLRLHWNPFYDLLEQRVLAFLSLDSLDDAPAGEAPPSPE